LLLCVVETGTCGANVCARADTRRRARYIGVGIPTTGARVQAYVQASGRENKSGTISADSLQPHTPSSTDLEVDG